jgi:hypothetical protein
MRSAGVILLFALALTACNHGHEERLGSVRSPDGKLIAVETMQRNGTLASDDLWIRLYTVRDGKLASGQQVFHGEDAELVRMRWEGDKRLHLFYGRNASAEIRTDYGFSAGDDVRKVEIIPHRVLDGETIKTLR